MSTDYELLEYDIEGERAFLTMDSLDNYNALSVQLLTDITDALREAERDVDVRVAILRGQEGIFSSGANMDEFSFKGSEAASGRIIGDIDMHGAFDTIEHLDLPVIAAVNGTALGGGFQLALVSDLTVVGEGVKMGFPEVTVGVLPGIGTIRVPEFVDKHTANEILMTGTIFTGQEIVDMGLFNDAVPDDAVMGRANELADQLVEAAPVPLKIIKKIINRHRGAEDNIVMDFGAGIVYETEDASEGINAFKEDRDPEFKGI